MDMNTTIHCNAEHLCLTSSRIGQGDCSLGELLMKNFLYTLARQEKLQINCISLMNSAVQLCCEGSESLEDLSLLAGRGIKIQACGTCLDFYQLKDKLAIGQIGNMQSIVAACTQQVTLYMG